MKASAQEVEGAEKTQAITPDLHPDARRLLVIDDEEVICQIVEGFMGAAGWEVKSVHTLAEAEAILRGREYPVVLCDVHMPGSSGELLRVVKARTPATQIVMFTGNPTITSAREAMSFGAYEYVPKPCRREELVHILERAYEKWRLLREQERLQAENEMYRKRLEELVAKRTEQLRQSELRYRAIFDRAVDAVLVIDLATRRVADHNIAARRFLECDGELLGRDIREVVGEQLDPVLAEAAAEGHREWRIPRMTFHRGDGETRIAQVSIGKIELEQQNCLHLVARDITDQIKLEERTAQIEAELLNEQRLAAIGLLASGVAHNINTPLMGIYGAAQLIKLKHPTLEDVDGIIAQVERINHIIRNLMWKSRQEQDTRVQEINMNQLLQEELRFLEADLDFKHNVEKRYYFADDVPVIMGRYSDFSQSLMNVVRNALDAMHQSRERVLTVRTETSGDELRITVEDTGCGIPPEHREKIFLPFFTTKPLVRDGSREEPSGTGLGLATAQKLLAPYGARFHVDSVVGQGTRFTISIPIACNSPRSVQELAAEG